MLTFPVETMALLTDGDDDFMDKEYADFTAQMWADGHSFFCYLSDSPLDLLLCLLVCFHDGGFMLMVSAKIVQTNGIKKKNAIFILLFLSVAYFM